MHTWGEHANSTQTVALLGISLFPHRCYNKTALNEWCYLRTFCSYDKTLILGFVSLTRFTVCCYDLDNSVLGLTCLLVVKVARKILDWANILDTGSFFLFIEFFNSTYVIKSWPYPMNNILEIERLLTANAGSADNTWDNDEIPWPGTAWKWSRWPNYRGLNAEMHKHGEAKSLWDTVVSPFKTSLELVLSEQVNLHVLEIRTVFIFLDSSFISHRNRVWGRKRQGIPRTVVGSVLAPSRRVSPMGWQVCAGPLTEQAVWGWPVPATWTMGLQVAIWVSASISPPWAVTKVAQWGRNPQ